MENNENKKNFNYTVFFASIIIVIIIILTMLASYAFFQFTRTGPTNTLNTLKINFEFVQNIPSIDIGNAFPISYNDIDVANELSFTLNGSSDLTDGIKYTVYAIRGDDVSGKDRLSDSVISMLYEPASDADGYTTTLNNFSTASSPVFVDGKAIISTGVIRNTDSTLPAKSYKLTLWIDSNKILVSSTTKRQNNFEGNPSIADSSQGTVTVGRYVENDNNLVDTVLYPAVNEYIGRTVYTTKEFANSYYSIKLLVEANENS